MKCDICGKRVQFGQSVSHSKKCTKRRWLANIHRVTIVVAEKKQKINICTRCLRSQYKSAR
ncbi:MAG: 50S ribosomal protein L28 [Dehalococcoidia bacterium]|nr:50S ribosomal protein L28 [Dehalococcoidia bacterium]